jgi:hypothetical protein
MPIFLWWGGSILVTAVGGWLTGFSGSGTIKNLLWALLVAAFAVAMFYVWAVK